jgi:superfamily II DNA or RNA helicase
MASGTGKTLVALWAAEQAGSHSTLVLVPSLALMAQTIREWRAERGAAFAAVAVCSDVSVAVQDEGRRSIDEVAGHATVTREPAAIAAFLGLDAPEPKVVFGTYQSSPHIAVAQDRHGAPAFDLAIADEAHRTVGTPGRSFSLIVDATSLRAHKRLFLTATPRLMTTHSRRRAAEDRVAVFDMDDDAAYGPLLHELSFGEAIARGLLADYRVLVSVCAREDFCAIAERADHLRVGGVVGDAASVAAGATLLDAMRRHDMRTVVTFHNRVRAAEEFAADLSLLADAAGGSAPPAGTITGLSVSGWMPESLRDHALERLRAPDAGERVLVSNARCLAEGVDVPALDAVAFVQPRGSAVDIVQAVGRVLRSAEGKQTANILIPVLLDEGGRADPSAALETSAFRTVWETLRALRSHDSRLASRLDALRRDPDADPGDALAGLVEVQSSRPLPRGFLTAFHAETVEQTTQAGWAYIAALERFAARVGHARPHYEHVEGELRLGAWVRSVRRQDARGRVPKDLTAALESLPGWTWDARDFRWNEGFSRLSAFAAEHGHSWPGASHVTDDGYALGAWAANQRKLHAQRRLSTRRIAQLEGLPGWRWAQPDWEERFARARAFVEARGRLPARGDAHASGLYRWLATQRERHRRGNLSDDQRSRLETLDGWRWDMRPDPIQRGIALLRRFAEREGHLRIPTGHLERGLRLDRFASSLRKRNRRGELSDEARALAESIPGWTWVARREARWERAFRALVAFHERRGHLRIPRRHVEDGVRLDSWASGQRAAHARGTLPAERRARLEALPGWSWSPGCQPSRRARTAVP